MASFTADLQNGYPIQVETGIGSHCEYEVTGCKYKPTAHINEEYKQTKISCDNGLWNMAMAAARSG
jgi:hypothetical protein